MNKKHLTVKYLDSIKPGYINAGYSVPKWVKFSEIMINHGWECYAYESKSTHSKYIYISKGKQHYKIRFSNHRPNKNVQRQNDSDFYVGVSNGNQVLTTEELIEKLTTHLTV